MKQVKYLEKSGVSELLNKVLKVVKALVTYVDKKLILKADQSDFEQLVSRVEALEKFVQDQGMDEDVLKELFD